MKSSFIPDNIIFSTDLDIQASECVPEEVYKTDINVIVGKSDSSWDQFFEGASLVFMDDRHGSFSDTENTIYYPVRFDLFGLDPQSRKNIVQVLAYCGIL